MLSNIQKSIVFLIVLVISVAVLILGFKFFSSKPPYTFDSNRVAVVKEIKDLNRLETAQYTIEKVIDAQTTQTDNIRQFLFGDKILLIAHGEVIAGFDMAKVGESDIQVEGKSLIINLPPPEILVSRIDNDRTKVYDRRQGLLTKGDNNLESAARQEAESEIRKAACESGILDQATTNARKQLIAMFKPLDFTTVIVRAPSGSCQ